MSVLGDADADAFTDRAGGRCGFAEPERSFPADKIEAIHAAGDSEGVGHAAGTSREIEYAGRAAAPLHLRDALERLDGANQDACANAHRTGGNIQHEVIAVTEINIGVAALEEERAIARSHAAEGVCGGVTDDVGFGFDDASGEANAWKIVNERFADQIFCEGDSVEREIAQAQARDTPAAVIATRASGSRRF